MRTTATLLTLAFAALAIAPAHAQITTARYVHATAGNDANDGLSAATAWQTLGKVNAQTWGPGGQILFAAGQTWTGRLAPLGSGSATAAIVIDQYGTGTKPKLQGQGTVNEVLYLYNQEYWEVNNLDISNLGASVAHRRAIYVKAQDIGAVDHLYFRNLVVHDVNSDLTSGSSRYYGGLFLEITGTTTPTYFNDLKIENNHFYDVDRTAISNDSQWEIRTQTSTWGQTIAPGEVHNWKPSLGVVIRGNLVERSGGNGIIVRVAKDALVEGNTLLYNGEQISGNATFCFNTDGTVFQFNEAAYTVYNTGDTDARGIDSDYRTKNTIIQFNYLHHNGKGGVVATGGAGGTNAYKDFNDGTVVRYNILVENEQHQVRVSGKLTNMRLHNNVFYTSGVINGQTIVEHGAWSGAAPDNVQYYSNIFRHVGTSPTWDFGPSTNNVFRNNLYHLGSAATNQPSDPYGIFDNAELQNPSPSATFSDLSGFKVASTSPAVGAGVRFSDHTDRDYFGNSISSTSLIDIGAHQVVGNRPRFLLTGADSYVRGGTFAAQNYGTATELHAKKHADSEYIRRPFFKFTPSAGYANVTKARLRLYQFAESGQDAHARFVATDTWTETGLTWNNRPTMSTTSDTVNLSGTGFIEFDVTSLVEADLEAGAVVSLAVDALETVGASANLAKFYSREELSDSRKGMRPALLITATSGPANRIAEGADVLLPATADLTLYPNPARGPVTLRLALPAAAQAEVIVFDLLGRTAWRAGYALDAGTQEVALDLDGLTAGVYLVQVQAGDWNATRKLVLVR